MINLEYSTKQMISYFIIVNRNFTLYKDKLLINYMEKLKNILELTTLFDEKQNGYHTHTLRHSLATLLYDENNTDIMVIKKILGHESLSATEVYMHISNSKMKEIMENCTISSILEKREENNNVKK